MGKYGYVWLSMVKQVYEFLTVPKLVQACSNMSESLRERVMAGFSSLVLENI